MTIKTIKNIAVNSLFCDTTKQTIDVLYRYIEQAYSSNMIHLVLEA